MDDILQAHKEVNLVFGINDSSILGALASIESAGRGTADKELLVGYDASEPALKYVVNNKSALKIEVGNPPRDQVNQAYNLLSKMIKGEEVPDRVKVNFCLVTAEDADKWLSEQYPRKR